MTPTSNNINYVHEVADLINFHHAAILGPNDFATIAEWEKEEIPLALVLSSVDEICEGSHEDALAIEVFEKKVNDDFEKWLLASVILEPITLDINHSISNNPARDDEDFRPRRGVR